MRTLSAALLVSAFVPASFAQKPATTPSGRAESAPAAHAATLPVTRVSLYKNGVGFFEHTGRVYGNAQVTIDFTDAQLNDVLQSLTAIDLNGGRIAGAGYNSTTPLEQQLKSLSLGLGEKTTFSGLFTALRGSRVEVTGSGAPFSGRIVDIEMHKTGPGKESAGMLEGRFLTVASDSGVVRIFQVTPTLSVRLLDTPAHTDLTQYLTLLDQNHTQGLRHLTLTDNGSGTREIRLSYISEVPIWKSTYRILFTEPPNGAQRGEATATLQGWSVVDNTTGTDWRNVQLSLIAGAPQSFLQPLSQPIYSRRPEVPIAQDPQLTPQTYDSSLSSDVVAAVPRPTARASSQAMLSSNGVAAGSGSGIGPGFGGNVGGGVMRIGSVAPTITYEDAAAQSLTPQTTAAGFDDFFAYNLTEPVTILKNTSALVPILQIKVPADRMTVVSSNGSSLSQPLRALWLTNSSNLTLDRGSFSIVEGGNFGGEGLLDPIHPGEKRLLSYAADQAVHASVEGPSSASRIIRISSAKGVLKIQRSEADQITYVFHNSAAEPRSIILEHPVQRGLTVSPTPAPIETTATVYRYRLEAAPGETVRLHLTGTRSYTSSWTLTHSDDNQLTFILNSADNNPQLVAALEPILQARRAVAAAQAAVDQSNARLNSLRSDEDRQRANITALQNADKSARDRFVADLNHTEDAINREQQELATRTAALDAAQAELANRIQSFQIDESL